MSVVFKYLQQQRRGQQAAETAAYQALLEHLAECSAQCADSSVDGVLPRCSVGAGLWSGLRKARDAA